MSATVGRGPDEGRWSLEERKVQYLQVTHPSPLEAKEVHLIDPRLGKRLGTIVTQS